MHLATMLLSSAIVAVAACGAKVAVGQPSAMRTLSSLDDDPATRTEQLESAAARPGPELKKGKTGKQLQAETVAATAAAIIGSFFSSTPNVVLGTQQAFDENRILEVPLPSAEATTTEASPPPGSCLLLLRTRPKSCDQPTD